MTVADILTGPFNPLGRWIGRRLMWVEHGFERARASDKAVDDTRLRIFFVLALFGAGFLTLSLGATRAAIFSPFGHGGPQIALSENARADIVDRNGQLMATDLVRYGLYVDPGEIVHRDLVENALLAAVPGISADKLAKVLAGDKRQYIVGGLTPEQRDQVHDLGLGGVSFEEEVGRDYPLGLMASHLLGYTSKNGPGAGVERGFDDAIRAQAGKDPVALSIDLRVQGALENELANAASGMQAQGGMGLVVNVRTGEILGLANWPNFDPNRIPSDKEVLVNHVAGRDYEPGSVMKIFTLAMGLDAGLATPETTFDVGHPLVLGSRIIHDYDHGPPTLTLSQVFTHSSNIGAARLGLEAGPERFERYYRSFGLFNAAPSELAESTRPILPKLNDDSMASMSFGHAIGISPLSLATGISAIMNGGVWRPLTLRKLAAGQVPATGRRVIQESTSRIMLDLMRQNVVGGTGRNADIPGLRVGGKTGTATKLQDGHYVENKNGQNLASFAAVFPTDAPFGADRYLVLIMIDTPKPTAADHGVTTGALTAAPTAGKVIDRIAPFLGVRRVIIASDLAPKPPADAASLGANEQ